MQFGIGALPEACLNTLAGHRDLGIHSGLLNDAAMRLIHGVATGTRKTVEPGVAVGGFLGGSAALFRFAHRNVAVRLRGTGYTHDPAVLAAPAAAGGDQLRVRGRPVRADQRGGRAGPLPGLSRRGERLPARRQPGSARRRSSHHPALTAGAASRSSYT